jgi:hypothetical protein
LFFNAKTASSSSFPLSPLPSSYQVFKIFENLSSSRPIPPFETQRSATIKIELYFLKLAETSTLANQERDPVSNQLHAR